MKDFDDMMQFVTGESPDKDEIIPDAHDTFHYRGSLFNWLVEI